MTDAVDPVTRVLTGAFPFILLLAAFLTFPVSKGPSNLGCVFELRELARMVPLERVVFVIDSRTDEKLLAETLGDCRAGVYRVDSMTGRHVGGLMRSLAAAAAPLEAAIAR